MTTAPKPMTPWQASLPGPIPRHVRRNIEPSPTGCWLWTRSRSRDGYGWASLDNKTWQAHRLLYTLCKGRPEEGKVLDHLCRVRHCVNPDHLEPVTPRENLERGETTTSVTHCAKGHELTRLATQRRCVTCRADYDESQREARRLYARAYRARKKEKTQ